MRLYNSSSPIDLRTPKRKGKRPWKVLSEEVIEPLTDREVEVLELIVEGLSSKLIAERMCLSIDTIETHRRNLIRKTKSANMIGVVVMGFRKGWVR